MPLMKQYDKYSVISEDDKEVDYSIDENYNQLSFVPSKITYDDESEEDEPSLKSDSIDNSKISYQNIIGSFKNIHDKIEQWNRNRDSTENKNFGSITQQNTAKFRSRDTESNKFLYEFEKNEDIDSIRQSDQTNTFSSLKSGKEKSEL